MSKEPSKTIIQRKLSLIKKVDLREYVDNDFGSFTLSHHVMPFGAQPVMSHVLNLSNLLLDTINQSSSKLSIKYQLSNDALANLVCVESSKLKRFKSVSSVLDTKGIGLALKGVFDLMSWGLDACEKAYHDSDYKTVVVLSSQVIESLDDSILLDPKMLASLDNVESIKLKVRKQKRQYKGDVSSEDAVSAFDALSERFEFFSTNMMHYSHQLQHLSETSSLILQPSSLSETSALLLRIYSSFPEYATRLSVYDVPYQMFADLIIDYVPYKSYISHLFAKLPSQASRWESDRHAPKEETQKLINVLYLHLSQFVERPKLMSEEIESWRNVVGHTLDLYGKGLLVRVEASS